MTFNWSDSEMRRIKARLEAREQVATRRWAVLWFIACLMVLVATVAPRFF